MEDVWLDALHHSISSSSWLDAARAWVDANCAAFEPDPSEFSCGQFQLFAEFRELADSLIGRVLDELGCNSPSAEDALVDALRRYAHADESAARGPRDAAARKCLATLIDLDDFERFAKMMAARNYELEHETAVTIERARQPRSEPVTPGDRRRTDSLEPKHSSTSPRASSSPRGSKTQNIAECKGCEDAKPSASDVEGDESSESARWRTQRAVASSLLEAAPSLEERDAPLLEWAEAVMRTHDSQADGADAALYRKLIRQRFRAELAVAQSRLAFERLARQDEIDAASSHEAMLAAALERADTVQRAAAGHRAACLRFNWRQQLAPPPADASAGATRSGLAPDSIEALYWHVKDCCARGADFSRASDVDALFAFFDGLARESGAPLGDEAVGVVPLCAQWVLLEEELRHLQRSVRELVGGEDERRGEATPTPFAAATAPALVATPAACATPTSGPWSGATTWAFENGVRDGEAAWYEQYDDGIGHHYYVNTFTGHSQWEPPECGYTPLVASDEAVASADDPMAALPKSPRPGATTAGDAADVAAPRPPAAADDRVLETGDAMIYMPTGEQVRVVKVHYEDEDPYYTVHMADGREKQTVRSKLANPTTSVFPDEGKAAEAERPWFKSLEICTSPAKDAGLEAEGAPSRTPAAVPPPVGLPPTGAAMTPRFRSSVPFLTEAAGMALPSAADAKEPQLPVVLPTPTPRAGLLSQEALEFLRQRVLSSGIPSAQPGIQMAQPGMVLQQPGMMMQSGMIVQPGVMVQPGVGMMATQGVMMQPGSMTHAGLMQPGVAIPQEHMMMMQQQQHVPVVMMHQQPHTQQLPPIQVRARVVPS